MKETKSISNYLTDVKWFAHAPGENAQYGTYRGLMILFDKVRYDEDKVVCKDTMGNGENSRYLTNRCKGIKHFGAGEYELDWEQFVPLKEIKAPAKIHVGDYFFATGFGNGGVQFKPIQSFTTNPWSGALDSFVCNSSYSFRGFCGGWRGGRVCMLQADDSIKELLKNTAVWI